MVHREMGLKFGNTPAESESGFELTSTHQDDCQPGYLSRVLKGMAEMSLEQAAAINEFYGHSDDESEFFILLVSFDRAGTPRLRKHFQRLIRVHQDRYLNLKTRLRIENHLSENDLITYFSHWHFGAIHAALSVPRFQNKETISTHFRIPLKRASEVIDYLIQTGLIHFKNGKYETGTARLHLGNDSPVIAKHHMNWRLQVMQALERESVEDLHYSSVVSLSESDIVKIKRQLITSIEGIKSVVRDSKEEAVACFCVDLFRL